METTIAKVGYAMITENADSINYDDIVYFKTDKAGGREVSAEPVGEGIKIWADGLPAVQGIGNSGYDIKLILLAILDDIQTAWFGKTKTANGSIVEKAEFKEAPKFALIVAKELFDGSTKYAIDTYYYCAVSNNTSKKSKTSEGKFDPEFPEISISASPRPDNKLIVVTDYANALPTKVTVPTEISTASEED